MRRPCQALTSSALSSLLCAGGGREVATSKKTESEPDTMTEEERKQFKKTAEF